jgi:hypothetical protein
MDKKNAPLFPQTTRNQGRQLSFHDFTKGQLPTMDELQWKRLNFMRFEIKRGLILNQQDQMDLIDIALAGVKALHHRNVVLGDLAQREAELNACRTLLASWSTTEHKNEIIAQMFAVLGNPKDEDCP